MRFVVAVLSIALVAGVLVFALQRVDAPLPRSALQPQIETTVPADPAVIELPPRSELPTLPSTMLRGRVFDETGVSMANVPITLVASRDRTTDPTARSASGMSCRTRRSLSTMADAPRSAALNARQRAMGWSKSGKYSASTTSMNRIRDVSRTRRSVRRRETPEMEAPAGSRRRSSERTPVSMPRSTLTVPSTIGPTE